MGAFLLLSSFASCGFTCRDEPNPLSPPGIHNDEKAAQEIQPDRYESFLPCTDDKDKRSKQEIALSLIAEIRAGLLCNRMDLIWTC